MGTGLLLSRHGERLHSLVQGGTGTKALDPAQPGEWPEAAESGTQNVPGILALGAGLDFVQNRGVDRIRQQELHHAVQLYEGLHRMPHIALYTQRPADPWYVPVLSFNIRGVPSETVGMHLARRDIAVRCGLHCAPDAHRKMGTAEDVHGGAVRVSPNVFTTDVQISRFLQAVAGLAGLKK